MNNLCTAERFPIKIHEDELRRYSCSFCDQKSMCKKQVLMKPEMKSLPKHRRVGYSMATGEREYNLLLPISVHSGAENVCHEVNTA